MGAQLGNSGMMSEINMTPLIDIVLVVLIIMMVNIPIQIEEMGLKLPSKPLDTPPPPEPSEQLVIAVYKPEAEGEPSRIALNRRVMNEQEMVYEITRRLKPMAKKNVFIDADKAVPYGLVVDMVDLARRAGAENVGLAKMKETGPLAPTEVSSGAGMPRGVVLGNPQVSGEMTTQIAYTSIEAIGGAIQGCYLQRLGQVPDLTGSYTVHVEVGPEGQLLKPPEITTDMVQDPALLECVTKVLPSLKYAPLAPNKTAAIRYPILFSPG